jgi:hypothetical protein
VTEPVAVRTRVLGLVGVPTSAGSHNAGQDQAPAAWPSVGLLARLEAAGVAVEDHGDLAVRRHRPAARVGGVRDLSRVAAVAQDVADQVDTPTGSRWPSSPPASTCSPAAPSSPPSW